MRIDVKQSPELRAVIFAMRALDRTIATFVRKEIKRVAEPEWKKALAHNSVSRLQNRVLVDTAVVRVSNQNLRVQSAMKGRPLSGGFNPKTDWPAAENGININRVATYPRRSRKGNVHQVTRNMRNGLPPRVKGGHVFGPAAREMIPRLGRLFFQTIYRTAANATEGKQE